MLGDLYMFVGREFSAFCDGFFKTSSDRIQSFQSQRLVVSFALMRRVGRWKKLWLGLSTMQWFVKSIEVCLKGNTDEFYSTMREDNRCFLAQRYSNFQGWYLVLVEYGGGSRCNFIFISEEKRCTGWRRLAEVLREATSIESLVILEEGSPQDYWWWRILLKNTPKGRHWYRRNHLRSLGER